MRIANAVNCSEHLVWILMNQDGGITHPNIANSISEYIVPTAEQRDSIVHPKYRGTWQSATKTKPDTDRHFRRWNAQPVVAVDRLGHVMKRFSSIKEAALYVGCSNQTISNRCNYVHMDEDEFNPYGMTFRFEADWERLTPEQRVNDIKKRSMQI